MALFFSGGSWFKSVMIIIAYGANLPSHAGDPRDTFQAARAALESRGVRVAAQSALWETAPVGTDDEQPWYTNAVWAVETDLTPDQLLALLHEVEGQFGRVRSVRNAARPIDLDLIDYHGQVMAGPDGPILPHPRMHERAFVLKPLEEIVDSWTHPISGHDLAQLVSELPADQLFRKL